MADGRDIACWDDHALDCEKQERKPFEIDNTTPPWLRESILSLENVTDVLDLGCGPAYWVNLFEGFKYYGFDQSRGMLNVAYKVLTDNDLLGRMVELRQGNARKLLESYPEQRFDLIFTSAVLQHNRHVPDKQEIVQGMYSILREGGYYLCTENTLREDNAPQYYRSEGPCDGYSFSVEGWRKFMRENGFEMLEYRSPSEYLYRKVSDV